MSEEIELKGTVKIVVLLLIGLIFFGITAYRLSLHFDKNAISALNRGALISTIGPWLGHKIQRHESGDNWVHRIMAKAKKGNVLDSRCTIGLIDVRGFGGRVIAGLNIIDSTGNRIRYFTLDWNSHKKAWVCDFYSAGDNSAIHPEEDGYGWIEQFFHRALLPGSTEYQDLPCT